MRTVILPISAVLAASLIWGSIVFMALDQGWLKSAIAPQGETQDFIAAAREIAEERNGGNTTFVMIEGGRKAGGFDLSKGEPVNDKSVFQVASISKWLTAWGVMNLADDGLIDLDAPVSDYISRWSIPESEFDPSGVTVRRLLSHTSGLADGLGYDGFSSPDERQTIEASLTQASDASSGKDGKTALGAQPGSGWKYSGGGYTLLQLMIEEVSGEPFPDYMQDRVFGPLGMTRTTFDHGRAIKLGLAQNFAEDGSVEDFRWYTSLAAASLFTTSGDLAKFIAAQTPAASNAVLSEQAMALMRAPQAREMGADFWGVGVMLYAPNNAGDFIIGHDGQNEPAINAAARLDPETGDGIVILSTGTPSLATDLAGEWVFWKTGNVDSLTFLSNFSSALIIFGIGLLAIILCGAFWAVKRRNSLRRAQA
ncbi:MAG: serine hydrolase domain-containing protein [Pseudomonadota bacterium]|nr:serine hydrolase domain-containing protein [Pseudomonadota bacterium]